jgi:serine/threonine protein kinase
LKPEQALFYTAEVLLGLDHMHKLNIIYRDLKPENVLLNSEGHAVISDLGLAVYIKPGEKLRQSAGTPGYWAPEIMKKQCTVPVTDYWSLGVMLYEMLAGERPHVKTDKSKNEWSCWSWDEVHEKTCKIKGATLKTETKYDPKKFTPDCIDLLKKIFVEDPEERIGAKGVQEVKDHPYFKSINWDQLEALESTPPMVPKRGVNAKDLDEVGEFVDPKGVKLDANDEKTYKDFAYVSVEGQQRGYYNALVTQAEQRGSGKDKPAGGGCCVVS